MTSRLHAPHAPRTLASLAALLGLLVALGGGLFAPVAGAAPVEEGSLSMTSEEGDWVGQGQAYSYATNAGDAFDSTGTASSVGVNVEAANGDTWHLAFGAPQGETLAVGTYDGAVQMAEPFRTGPGLDISGNGRGCGALTGSFTVTAITFGDGGWVRSFDADFEQRCYETEAALRGHVHVVNAPPPPPLSIGLALAGTGSVDRATGTAVVSGTVTCNKPTRVQLAGTLIQKRARTPQAVGGLSHVFQCSGETPWQADVSSYGTAAFGPGTAQLSVRALAFDTDQEIVIDDASATVKLMP